MIIEFITEDESLLKFYHPVKTEDCLNDKIKDLSRPKETYKTDEIPIQNIFSCLPAIDYAKAGYIIKNSHNLKLELLMVNFKEVLSLETSRNIDKSNPNFKFLNEMGLYNEKLLPAPSPNKFRNYFKHSTDWGIRTPKGYSSLILQPFYILEERYSVLPAIVDTDTYHRPIPLVGYLNTKESVNIMPGDPVLQVIPFKRDDWTMSVKLEKVPIASKFWLWNGYKNFFHKIKNYG